MSNERQPLLDHSPPLDGVALPESEVRVKEVPGAHPGPLEITRATRAGILGGIWIAMFLAAVDGTMVATLISSISSEFNRSNQSSWLGTSFLLAGSTFTPLYGQLCDILGRRTANQTAVILTGVGTLACGLSNSLEMLIAARFLSGVGGGGVWITATVITSDMYSMRERGTTQGIAALFVGAGLGLGGPLGGWISDRFGWRWAFLMQVPFFALSVALTAANLNYVTPGRGQSTREVLKRIDYGGCLTMFTGIGGLLLFFSFKYNQEFPWDSPQVVTSLVVMGVSVIAFLTVELKLAVEPMLAPSLLRQRVPVIAGCSNALVSMVIFAVTYFFPLWFETVQLRSASIAGVHLLPNSVSLSLGALFSGWYMSKTGRYRLLTNLFGTFPFVASVLMCFLREDSSEFYQWISIVPQGFGNAVVLQTTFMCLLASIDNSAVAVATGFVQCFRGVGQVLGLAVSSALFQSILDKQLRIRITGEGADELISRIRHSTKLVHSLEPYAQRAARDSYGLALKGVFMFAIIGSLVSYILRLWLPEIPLDPAPNSSTASARLDSAQSNRGAIDDPERGDSFANSRSSSKSCARRLSALESDDRLDSEDVIPAV